jgi:hypothetical protein
MTKYEWLQLRSFFVDKVTENMMKNPNATALTLSEIFSVMEDAKTDLGISE